MEVPAFASNLQRGSALHPHHPGHRSCGTLFRGKEQKEVGGNLDGAGRIFFRVVHRLDRGYAAARIASGPIALTKDQYWPHFPPDRILDRDLIVIDDMA